MIVDSHCHLDYPNLYDQLDNVVIRAKQNKVDYLLTICTTLESFEKHFSYSLCASTTKIHCCTVIFAKFCVSISARSDWSPLSRANFPRPFLCCLNQVCRMNISASKLTAKIVKNSQNTVCTVFDSNSHLSEWSYQVARISYV